MIRNERERLYCAMPNTHVLYIFSFFQLICTYKPNNLVLKESGSIASNISDASTEPWFCEPCRANVKDPTCQVSRAEPMSKTQLER